MQELRKRVWTDQILTPLFSLFPYYMYCVDFWDNAKESYLNPLIKLQKRSVRIITHSHNCSHTKPLFSKLDSLPLSKLVLFGISLTMFRLHLG